MVVSTDVRRPAAIEQLSVLASQAGVRVHDPDDEPDETVIVDVTSVAGANESGTQQVTTTILDDAMRLAMVRASTSS